MWTFQPVSDSLGLYNFVFVFLLFFFSLVRFVSLLYSSVSIHFVHLFTFPVIQNRIAPNDVHSEWKWPQNVCMLAVVMRVLHLEIVCLCNILAKMCLCVFTRTHTDDIRN